jgi:simple sugar transport system permease protein
MKLLPIYLQRRAAISSRRAALLPIFAIATGFIVGAVVLWFSGVSPLDAYLEMFNASFGSAQGLTATFIRAAPLILTGLAVAIALQMQLWNIGAEGQLLLGSAGATFVFFTWPNLPGPILLVAAAVAALIAGALWALIAAIPRATIDLNEIITTLFLNYIALRLVSFLVYGPWQDPGAIGFAYSKPIPPQGVMGTIWGTDLTSGVVLSIVCVAITWWGIERTRWGFSVKILGGNPRAGAYLRLNAKRRIISIMAISGAIAGMAGFIQLTAVTGRLQPDIAAGYGYTGILVAFLAGRSLLMIPVVGIFFSALIQGGYSLQAQGLSSSISTVLQGLIVLFILLGGVAATYRFRWSWTSSNSSSGMVNLNSGAR